MPSPTPDEVDRVITAAVEGFKGNLNDLSSAVGMLVIGQRYGWRVILLIHSQATIRKYLRILGLKSIRDAMPEVGDLSGRSNAWRLVEGTSNFWKAVRGQLPGIRSGNVDGDAT